MASKASRFAKTMENGRLRLLPAEPSGKAEETAEKTPALTPQAIKRSLSGFLAKSLPRASIANSFEETFRKRKMPKQQRINLLLEAMGNPAVSYSSGFPSAGDRYEILLNSFIAGIWRPNYSSLKAKGKLEAL